MNLSVFTEGGKLCPHLPTPLHPPAGGGIFGELKFTELFSYDGSCVVFSYVYASTFYVVSVYVHKAKAFLLSLASVIRSFVLNEMMIFILNLSFPIPRRMGSHDLLLPPWQIWGFARKWSYSYGVNLGIHRRGSSIAC